MRKNKRKLIVGFAFVLGSMSQALAQSTTGFKQRVINEEGQPISDVTVELLSYRDSSFVMARLTDSAGVVLFDNIKAGTYFSRMSRVGFIKHSGKAFILTEHEKVELPEVQLHQANKALAAVTVIASKPFIEIKPGKTVVNMEAGFSSAGTTAMEALEKLPGITIDKEGNVLLKGRSGVTILVDGKQTFLDGAQLSTLLGGMSASQISQVEIMDAPPASFDAAGNAGVINIKTKKSNQKGFNSSLTTSFSQGRYAKYNNNVQLNYRSGSLNTFFNYSLNNNRNFTRIEATRRYYKEDDITLIPSLEQPSFLDGRGAVHNLRTGLDYNLNTRSTIGLVFTGLVLNRKSSGNNEARWLAPGGRMDSIIQTNSNNNNHWESAGASLSFNHNASASRTFSSAIDLVGYKIRAFQHFNNSGVYPAVYQETTRASLPSTIKIISGRGDYADDWKGLKWETGIKTAHITTDNLAAYEWLDGNNWYPDEGKSNHFLYTEDIHALYLSGKRDLAALHIMAGLRFERTAYVANQLGNAMVKDSSFSRSYNSLFPNLSLSFDADSANSFSLSAGRRIDRPAFQKLNPFVFIINKYTYQQGNPYFRPQYTWNVNLSHSYKNLLITSVSYSTTTDYFSQVFPVDSNGLVIYTEGNLTRLQNLGLSVSLQLPVSSWWSINVQGVVNRRNMQGVIGKNYDARFTQWSLNMSQQFRFKNGWGGELSGFFTSKSKNDIQEVVDPAGQLSLGVSRSVLKNKGNLKLAARDLFYTQWMKGFTSFYRATETFKLTRDTRVMTLSFSYRFGKTFKSAKPTERAAVEEIQRVGNG
jgi:iron complex outermembrane recepter protein